MRCEDCGSDRSGISYAYEDCSSNKSGIFKAYEYCSSSRLGVFEACEDGIDRLGMRVGLGGENFSFEMFLN
ncbi:unnamed protein product [Prunus armeniaca]